MSIVVDASLIIALVVADERQDAAKARNAAEVGWPVRLVA